MGLIKTIELKNGVTTNYHRIVSINNIINEQTIIEVASYTSKAKREEEQTAQETGKKSGEAPTTNIFIDTTYLSKEYGGKTSVEDCYNYLKTTEKFKDAKDE